MILLVKYFSGIGGATAPDNHFCLKRTISDLEITYSLNFVLEMNFRNYLIVLEFVAWPLDKSTTGWFLDRPVCQNWFIVLVGILQVWENIQHKYGTYSKSLKRNSWKKTT